jgi:chromosome segregation ATPase
MCIVFVGESESELLAKIHMIKLYFNHALKDEEGIIRLPKLDSRCVKKSFEEMSQDYEDDGLFDEMMQFFLPLTVTDNELELDKKEIRYNTEKKRQNQSQIESEIENLTKRNEILIKNIEERKRHIQEIKVRRQKMYEELERKIEEIKKKQPTSYSGAKSDFEKEWSQKDTIESNRKKTFEKEIDQFETKLKTNEALIQEKNNLLKTILDDINNQQTHIDQKLIKPHRGFIMYGPPGKFYFHILFILFYFYQVLENLI